MEKHFKLEYDRTLLAPMATRVRFAINSKGGSKSVRVLELTTIFSMEFKLGQGHNQDSNMRFMIMFFRVFF